MSFLGSKIYLFTFTGFTNFTASRAVNCQQSVPFQQGSRVLVPWRFRNILENLANKGLFDFFVVKQLEDLHEDCSSHDHYAYMYIDLKKSLDEVFRLKKSLVPLPQIPNLPVNCRPKTSKQKYQYDSNSRADPSCATTSGDTTASLVQRLTEVRNPLFFAKTNMLGKVLEMLFSTGSLVNLTHTSSQL